MNTYCSADRGDVDATVKRHNRLWIIDSVEHRCSFDDAYNKTIGISKMFPDKMIICRFPKHIDDEPRDYSSFYAITR